MCLGFLLLVVNMLFLIMFRQLQKISYGLETNYTVVPWNVLCNSLLEKQMGQIIQEWTKYFKDCLPQILLGPFLSTWSQTNIVIV